MTVRMAYHSKHVWSEAARSQREPVLRKIKTYYEMYRVLQPLIIELVPEFEPHTQDALRYLTKGVLDLLPLTLSKNSPQRRHITPREMDDALDGFPSAMNLSYSQLGDPSYFNRLAEAHQESRGAKSVFFLKARRLRQQMQQIAAHITAQLHNMKHTPSHIDFEDVANWMKYVTSPYR